MPAWFFRFLFVEIRLSLLVLIQTVFSAVVSPKIRLVACSLLFFLCFHSGFSFSALFIENKVKCCFLLLFVCFEQACVFSL